MARDKHPRPMVGKAPTKRHNVSLPPEIAEELRLAGSNNLSAGIRLAAESLRRSEVKKR